MFAVGLLAAVSLTLMGVFGMGIRLTGQNRDSVTATQLGHAVLEKLASGMCQVPAGTVSCDGAVPTPAIKGWPPAPYPGATVGDVHYTLRVATAPVAGVPGLFSVQVMVSWSERKNVTLHAYHHRP